MLCTPKERTRFFHGLLMNHTIGRLPTRSLPIPLFVSSLPSINHSRTIIRHVAALLFVKQCVFQLQRVLFSYHFGNHTIRNMSTLLRLLRSMIRLLFTFSHTMGLFDHVRRHFHRHLRNYRLLHHSLTLSPKSRGDHGRHDHRDRGYLGSDNRVSRILFSFLVFPPPILFN